MIDIKTVFILGAGSNAIFGFPTGLKLRRDIVDGFTKNFGRYLSEIPGNYRRLAERFVSSFNRSNIKSIDRFLAERSVEFYEIGTMAIALSILRAECNCDLSSDLNFKDIGKDPYFYLFNAMIEGIDEASIFDHFRKNKASFVTFNYDRSLDHYLYDSFVHCCSPSKFQQEEISKYFPFKIIHAYGSVPLEWQAINPPHLDFMKGKGFDKISFGDIEQMSKNIRIISKERNDDERLLEMQKLILNADRIFFLGFGYAPENLEVLDIPNRIKDKMVYGTARGWTDKKIIDKLNKLNPENYEIERRAGNTVFSKGCVTLMKTDCVGLLEEYL